jgi:prolyl 4-hydroxylase
MSGALQPELKVGTVVDVVKALDQSNDDALKQRTTINRTEIIIRFIRQAQMGLSAPEGVNLALCFTIQSTPSKKNRILQVTCGGCGANTCAFGVTAKFCKETGIGTIRSICTKHSMRLTQDGQSSGDGGGQIKMRRAPGEDILLALAGLSTADLSTCEHPERLLEEKLTKQGVSRPISALQQIARRHRGGQKGLAEAATEVDPDEDHVEAPPSAAASTEDDDMGAVSSSLLLLSQPQLQSPEDAVVHSRPLSPYEEDDGRRASFDECKNDMGPLPGSFDLTTRADIFLNLDADDAADNVSVETSEQYPVSELGSTLQELIVDVTGTVESEGGDAIDSTMPAPMAVAVTRSSVRRSERKPAVQPIPRGLELMFHTKNPSCFSRRIEVLHSGPPNVLRCSKFLTDVELLHFNKICTQYEAKFEASFTEGAEGEASYTDQRTSWFLTIDKSQDTHTRTIESRAADMMGLPQENIEPMQIVRYTRGQQFSMHHDAGTISEDDDTMIAIVQPKRLTTIFVYLNDLPYGQGHTEFPYLANLSVQPRAGDAILFCNLLRDGTGDYRVCHKACPVQDQLIKYGLNIWIADKSFAEYSLVKPIIKIDPKSAFSVQGSAFALADAAKSSFERELTKIGLASDIVAAKIVRDEVLSTSYGEHEKSLRSTRRSGGIGDDDVRYEKKGRLTEDSVHETSILPAATTSLRLRGGHGSSKRKAIDPSQLR